MLDYAYSTVNEMEILKVKPTPFMQRMASLLRDAAFELLHGCGPPGGSSRRGHEHAQRAKRWKTGSKMSTAKRWQTCSAARKISSTWSRC